MSTLQIGLAIAGGLLLAAVIAHGAWSARKVTPRQALPGEDAGATEPVAGVEPSLDPGDFDPPPVPQPSLPRARCEASWTRTTTTLR